MTSKTLRFYTVEKLGKCKVLTHGIATETGGLTVNPGIGFWIDDSGDLVEETSATIVVLADVNSIDFVRELVDLARIHHGETSVEWSIDDVKMPTIR